MASPPLEHRLGFAKELAAWSARFERDLDQLLPSGVTYAGESTHISVSMLNATNDKVLRLFARSFAPSLILICERRNSYGIWLRPRPRRGEFCTEHVNGDLLRAAALFATGGVLACARALRAGKADNLPPLVRTSLAPARERFGWFVHRAAFNCDLHDEGRAAQLHSARYGTITAQRHLELAWESIVDAIGDTITEVDRQLVRRLIAGDSLGVERNYDQPLSETVAASTAAPTPYGDVLKARERPPFRCQAIFANWEASVFRIWCPARDAFMAVPSAYLADFLDALDEGRLDSFVSALMAKPANGHHLNSRWQILQPGVFDTVGDLRQLLPEERELTSRLADEFAPQTVGPQNAPAGETSVASPEAAAVAGVAGSGESTSMEGRLSKWILPLATEGRLPEQPIPPRFGWLGRGGTFWLIALLVLALGGGGVAYVASNGGGSQGSTTHGSSGTSTKPASALSLPTVYNRELVFSAASASGTSATPSTYLVTLRPGTVPGEFVETDTYPTTDSQQIQTETYSTTGIGVTGLENTSPSGTLSFEFSPPLPLLKAPYFVGQSWSATSTGSSSSGEDDVQLTDRISDITHLTVAGTTLQVIEVTIHHTIAETTPSGTVSQESTGTEFFSPLLGVFVSGESTEVTGGKSTTNQFTLQSIGMPISGSSTPTGSPSTPVASGQPVITSQPQNQQVAPYGTASFQVVASGAATYEWQYSPDGGMTWVPIQGGTAPGWFQEITPSMNGHLFRMVVSNASGQTTSDAASVTVIGG